MLLLYNGDCKRVSCGTNSKEKLRPAMRRRRLRGNGAKVSKKIDGMRLSLCRWSLEVVSRPLGFALVLVGFLQERPERDPARTERGIWDERAGAKVG